MPISSNISFRSPKHLRTLASLGSALLLLSACGDDERSVHASLDVIDRAGGGFGDFGFRAIHGSYENCKERDGHWSLAIDFATMLQNEELSVVLNDTDCVLTLDSVTMSDDLLTPHTATPTITLGTGYADAASGFGDPMWFYGNARLSAITFADDFVLTFLFSDDPGLAGDDDEATFDVVGSSATAEEVPAPDYTIDASLIAVTADANNIVQTATGSAELTAGLVTGDTYVVVEASGLYAYAAIDAAYLGVTAATTFALEIPAADFTLVGTDLTDSQVRTLIIANIDSGVRSYQAFEITFNPVAVESCGNGILDEGEFCDGSSNLGGWDCSEWNGPGWTGELNCSEDCQIILDDNCSFAG